MNGKTERAAFVIQFVMIKALLLGLFILLLAMAAKEAGAGEIEAAVVGVNRRERTLTLEIPRSYLYSPVRIRVTMPVTSKVDLTSVVVPFNTATVVDTEEGWRVRLAVRKREKADERLGGAKKPLVEKLVWVKCKGIAKVRITEKR